MEPGSQPDDPGRSTTPTRPDTIRKHQSEPDHAGPKARRKIEAIPRRQSSVCCKLRTMRGRLREQDSRIRTEMIERHVQMRIRRQSLITRRRCPAESGWYWEKARFVGRLVGDA